MIPNLRVPGTFAMTFLLFAMAACGGGGGETGSQGAVQLPLSELSQDIVPSGARVDVVARNLFPVHSGDSWVYERREGNTTGAVGRAIGSGPDADGNFVVSETENGSTEYSAYRRGSSGIEALDPFGAQGVWPGLYAALPSLLEYPTPFYPVGAQLERIRQGSLGADVDNDGKNDYYRAEVTQVFRGFESSTVFGQPVEVAHFTNRIALTVATTGNSKARTITAVEEAFFASNLGLVRAARSASASDGEVVVAPYTIDLAVAAIDGARFDANGRSRPIALAHSALVFDTTRNVYYASIGGASAQGNRIATVDAETGVISYSAVVGSDPSTMAISADASVLYVGLAGSGEVVRLALPGMQETGRVRLPVDSLYGQLLPEEIAASPVDADVFAVSLMRLYVSPRHGGVALVRNMSLQPQRTQDPTGSNRIGFGADGAWLYGYNNETSEFGLRRIEVLADGVAERSVVLTGSQYGGSLDVRDGLVIVGSRVHRADASLDLLGTVANSQNCAKLSGTDKLGCQSLLGLNRLNVAGTNGFALLGSPTYAQVGTSTAWRLVPGRTGSVAVSEGGTITLFTGASLQ